MWQMLGWLVSSVLGAAIWTLVVRQSPVIVTNLITAKIKRHYNEQLAQLKGAITKERTAIQSAIGFLSATQSELRSKTFHAVEALWTVIEKQQEVYGDAFFLLDILTPKELNSAFQQSSNAQVQAILSNYSDYELLSKAVFSTADHLEKWEIIYVSARLWLIYETLFRTQNRIAGLMHQSLEQRKFKDWRTDDLLVKQAMVLLNEEEFKRLTRSISPKPLINSLRAQFIEDARKIVRGANEWETVDDIYTRLMSLQSTEATSRNSHP